MWAKLVLGGSTKEERAEGLSRLKDQPQGWGGVSRYISSVNRASGKQKTEIRQGDLAHARGRLSLLVRRDLDNGTSY